MWGLVRFICRVSIVAILVKGCLEVIDNPEPASKILQERLNMYKPYAVNFQVETERKINVSTEHRIEYGVDYLINKRDVISLLFAYAQLALCIAVV